MSEESFDVIAVGGGTAGSMAALAAARNGARTCLIESGGFIGGTCLALANATPFHNNRGDVVVGGYPQELVTRMISAGGAMPGGHLPNPSGICGSFTPLDPDVMKLVLFDMLVEAGVELWLHTVLIGSETEAGKVVGVRVSNKSGVQKLNGKVLIDATGDADLAVSAGADYHQDVPEESLNATLLFRVAGVESDLFIADVKANPAHITMLADPYLVNERGLTPESVMEKDFNSILDTPYIYIANLVRDFVPQSDWPEWEIRSAEKQDWGKLRPFGSRIGIMSLPSRTDLVTINATSITFDATDAAQIALAEVEGQRQIHQLMAVLRRYVPGFANSHLHSTLPKISVRASRRIIGAYQLTRDDVKRECRFPDGIARGSYPMSVQSVDVPNVRKHLFVNNGGDYDIPYRCLVPKEIDGLLVAGRCLSATREASGSARMGAQCMAYGQAAGTAAAIAARKNIEPRAVDYGELRSTLIQANAVI